MLVHLQLIESVQMRKLGTGYKCQKQAVAKVNDSIKSELHCTKNKVTVDRHYAKCKRQYRAQRIEQGLANASESIQSEPRKKDKI